MRREATRMKDALHIIAIWTHILGIALILIAGGYLIADWRNFYGIPSDTGFNDLRFGIIFSVKMVLLVIMLIIVGIHTWKVGPKLMDTLQAQADGKPVT